MSQPDFSRSHEPDLLSRIGGAANSGSAKPKEELEKINREHGLEQDPPPGADAGSGEPRKPGTVGGNSNDKRTDQERSSDPD